MNKIKIILIVCLIIYLITAFGTEILYRNKLYEISVDYIEKIKQEGFANPYEYTLGSMLFRYPDKAAPVIENIIDFWKEKYNLNIIEEDGEPEFRKLLTEARNYTGFDDSDDEFCSRLSNAFYDCLKYPGINYRGTSYLETGNVNTDKVIINGIV